MRPVTVLSVLSIVPLLFGCATNGPWDPDDLEALSLRVYARLHEELTPAERAEIDNVSFSLTRRTETYAARADGDTVYVTEALADTFVRPLRSHFPLLQNSIPDGLERGLAEIEAEYGSLDAYERPFENSLFQESTAAFVIAHEMGHVIGGTAHHSHGSEGAECREYPFCVFDAVHPAELAADRFALDLVERAGLPPVPAGLFAVMTERIARIWYLFGELQKRFNAGPRADLHPIQVIRSAIAHTETMIERAETTCNDVRSMIYRIEALAGELDRRGRTTTRFSRYYPRIAENLRDGLAEAATLYEACMKLSYLAIEAIHQIALASITRTAGPVARAAVVRTFEDAYRDSLVGRRRMTWHHLRRALLGGEADRWAILTEAEVRAIAAELQAK